MDTTYIKQGSQPTFAPQDDLGRFRRQHHRWMLAIAVAVVVLSFLLEAQRGERVALRGLSNHPLPHLCTARRFWEAGCPGCGLTRSFIALAAGDLERSLAMHRLGWLLALAVVFQVPYRIVALSRRGEAAIGSRVGRWFGVFVVLALIVDWVLGPVLHVV